MKTINCHRDYNKLFLLLILGFISLSFCDNLSITPSTTVKSSVISEQQLNTKIFNNTYNYTSYTNITTNSTNLKNHFVKLSGNSTSAVSKQSDHYTNQTSDGYEGLKGNLPSLNPGAVKRAFYVFLGLTVISVAYLLFRSSRLRQSPAQMVRKYGVLTHKQDIEMRPLPLDEDDEDDTVVFDASGFMKNTSMTSKNF